MWPVGYRYASEFIGRDDEHPRWILENPVFKRHSRAGGLRLHYCKRKRRRRPEGRAARRARIYPAPFDFSSLSHRVPASVVAPLLSSSGIGLYRVALGERASLPANALGNHRRSPLCAAAFGGRSGRCGLLDPFTQSKNCIYALSRSSEIAWPRTKSATSNF